MKKIISLILVMALCMSLSIAAFAAENSPGSNPPATTGDTSNVGIWMVVMAVAVVALFAVVVVFKKTQKK